MESVIDTQTLTNFINSTTQNLNVNNIVSDSVTSSVVSNSGNNVNYINSHSTICAMSSDDCCCTNNNVVFYYSTASAATAINNIANKVS